MNNTDVPIWEKYTLTVEEASKYFRIGTSVLFIIYAPPLLCVIFLTSRQTALESSVSISTIPIPVGRTAPCGRIIIL